MYIPCINLQRNSANLSPRVERRLLPAYILNKQRQQQKNDGHPAW